MDGIEEQLDCHSNLAGTCVTTAIRVSGLDGRWFQAPSEMPVGLLPGLTEEDANPDLGDSAITETAGFGGMSLAASPALFQLVGGTVSEAVGYSREMYNITRTQNPAMSLPLFLFRWGAYRDRCVRSRHRHLSGPNHRDCRRQGARHRADRRGYRAPSDGALTEALAALLETMELS